MNEREKKQIQKAWNQCEQRQESATKRYRERKKDREMAGAGHKDHEGSFMKLCETIINNPKQAEKDDKWISTLIMDAILDPEADVSASAEIDQFPFVILVSIERNGEKREYVIECAVAHAYEHKLS